MQIFEDQTEDGNLNMPKQFLMFEMTTLFSGANTLAHTLRSFPEGALQHIQHFSVFAGV